MRISHAFPVSLHPGLFLGLGVFLLPMGLALSAPPGAAAQDEDLRFQVVEMRGKVLVYRDETDETSRLHKGQTADDGDRITTQSHSEAVLRLKGRATLYLGPHTVLRVTRLVMGDKGPRVRLNLVQGRLLCQLDRTPAWAFEVSAGNLICRAHGTLFEATRKKDDFLLVCYEGNVVGTSPRGRAQMAKARQVVKFSAGKFRYRRYLRTGEEEDLQAWKGLLKGLRRPVQPRSPVSGGR